MIHIHPEVLHALKNHQAVVALESTIISHGMPYPENVEMANTCEAIIRKQGSVPATIAIINGVMTIGLTGAQIELLAKLGPQAMKVSTRDIPYAISQKKTGALTVAATVIACENVGIFFFATGGIGGVHRGAETTFDVSADLIELSKRSVCVVSAGMKSILDLEKTLEYLETHGVPVIGYQTDYLPAFYVPRSSHRLELRLDTPKEVARFLDAKWSFPLPGGVILANPIPKDAALDETVIEGHIQAAIQEMNQQHITGKAQTPYLLKTIVEKSQGKSLQANLALVYHNCLVASQLAKAYEEVRK